MNIKQILVIILVIIGIIFIINLTPKYKKVNVLNEGFIRAEEGNPLYKNIKAQEQLNFKKIALYSSPVMIIGALLLLVFRDKKKKLA